jgi:hypothetical protein
VAADHRVSFLETPAIHTGEERKGRCFARLPLGPHNRFSITQKEESDRSVYKPRHSSDSRETVSRKGELSYRLDWYQVQIGTKANALSASTTCRLLSVWGDRYSRYGVVVHRLHPSYRPTHLDFAGIISGLGKGRDKPLNFNQGCGDSV